MDRSRLTDALKRGVPRRRTRRFLAVAGALLAAGIVWFWRLLPQPLFTVPLSYVAEARDGTLLSARIAADGQWRFPPSTCQFAICPRLDLESL